MKKFYLIAFFILLSIVNVRAQSIITLLGDEISSNVEEDYNNGKKWISYLHADLGVGGTVYIDMADYMAITEEGQDGWVTVWFEVNLNVGLPVGIGCVPRKYDLNARDDAPYFLSAYGDVTLGGFTVAEFSFNSYSFDEGYATADLAIVNQGYEISFGISAGAIVSSLEIQKEYLDLFFNSCTAPWYTPKQLANALVNSIANEVGWKNILKRPVRLPTISDETNEVIKSVEYSGLAINQWGKVYVNVLPKESDSYKVGVWDPTGLLPPDWDWANENLVGVPWEYAEIIGNNSYTFEFTVKPDSENAQFKFVLRQRNESGLVDSWNVVETYDEPFKIYALPEGSDVIGPKLETANYNVEQNSIDLSFDEAIDISSVNRSSVYIFNSGNVALDYLISNPESHIIRLSLTENLCNEEIELHLSSYVMDLNGNRLDQDKDGLDGPFVTKFFSVEGVCPEKSLSSGIIDQTSGSLTGNYYCSTIYKDESGQEPQYVNLIINGSIYEMGLESSYVELLTGATYSCTYPNDVPGTYPYYFEAKTASGETLRYPETGELSLVIEDETTPSGSMTIEEPASSYYVGQSDALTIRLDQEISGVEVNCSSSNPSVVNAWINSSTGNLGVTYLYLEFLKVGTATVTCSAPNFGSKSVTINVIERNNASYVVFQADYNSESNGEIKINLSFDLEENSGVDINYTLTTSNGHFKNNEQTISGTQDKSIDESVYCSVETLTEITLRVNNTNFVYYFFPQKNSGHDELKVYGTVAKEEGNLYNLDWGVKNNERTLFFGDGDYIRTIDSKLLNKSISERFDNVYSLAVSEDNSRIIAWCGDKLRRLNAIDYERLENEDHSTYNSRYLLETNGSNRYIVGYGNPEAFSIIDGYLTRQKYSGDLAINELMDIAVNPVNENFAISVDTDANDPEVYIYNSIGSKIKELNIREGIGESTSLSYSPKGQLIVAEKNHENLRVFSSSYDLDYLIPLFDEEAESIEWNPVSSLNYVAAKTTTKLYILDMNNHGKIVSVWNDIESIDANLRMKWSDDGKVLAFVSSDDKILFFSPFDNEGPVITTNPSGSSIVANSSSFNLSITVSDENELLKNEVFLNDILVSTNSETSFIQNFALSQTDNIVKIVATDEFYNSTVKEIALTVDETGVEYTVTFIDWDGSVLKTESVAENGSASAPDDPTRDGFTFSGWDLTFDEITSDLTVTAQYTVNASYYTVTFVDWDSTVLKTESVIENGSATAPADPTREGYIFIGWDTDFSNVTNDLTVFAQYQSNVEGMTYVPDDNFEQALIDLGYDDVLDDYVLTIHISEVMELDLSNKEISDLTGIKDFSSLTKLYCQDNILTRLNISQNNVLQTLYCWNNQLASLDVSQNTALSNLYCGNNKLTSLNVSNNSNLGILSCSSNELTNLDVSLNSALARLDCQDNQLTSLDVSHNSNLINLSFGNEQLIGIDISQNTALKSLIVMNTQFSNFDISYNTALISLRCYDNLFTSIDLSQNILLEELYLYRCQLTNLDVSHNKALIRLRSIDNQFSSLDVSQNTALTFIYCYGSHLTSLNLKNGNNSEIETFNATQNPDLTCIEVDDPVAAESYSGWFKDASASYSEDCGSIYYQVYFYDWDGTLLKVDTVLQSFAANPPSDPYCEAYTFVGWDTDFSSITSDLTVTAQYSSNVTTYTVTFVGWDGSVLKTETVVENGSATAPANPTRDGYTFTGWDVTFDDITSDLTVTAQYSTSEITYNVTFVDWDGSVLKTETVVENGSATAPANPTRDGYTFTGWDVTFDDITTDLTVTAQYSANTTVYTVTFADWDGTVLKTESVVENSSATAPANPTREGYKFTGWDTDFSNVTSNLTVTAIYVSSNTSLVTIEVINGETWSPENPFCDGDNNEVTVMLLNNNSPDINNPLYIQVTNSSGKASFENIPYATYNVYLKRGSLSNLLESEFIDEVMVGFVPVGIFQYQAAVDGSGQPGAYVGGPIYRDYNSDGKYDIEDKEPGKKIDVSDNTENYICYIFSTAPQGEFTISGYVYKDSTTTTKGVFILSESLEDRSPMQNVAIMLFEKGQDEAIAIDSTDDEGYYEFNKLAAGNYEIQVKLTGMIDSEKFEVELNENLPDVEMSFVVNKGDGTITDVSVFNKFNLNLYPNPSEGEVFLDFGQMTSKKIELVVFTIEGAKVLQRTYLQSEKISFNISEHVSGMYFVKIAADDQQIMKKLILDKK